MNFGRIAITLVSCLSFSILGVVEARGDKGIVEPMKNNQEKTTSEDKLNDCYRLIQKKRYPEALNCFKDAIKTNDSTVCGDVLDVIITGLTNFRYLKSSEIEIDNYALVDTFKNKLLNVSEENMENVFSAIYEIANEPNLYSDQRLDKCFEQIKKKREEELATKDLTEVLEPRKRKNEKDRVAKDSAELSKIKKRKINTNVENPIPVVVK